MVPEELACKKEIVEPTWSSLSGLLLDKRVAKQIVKFFSFGCANPTQPNPTLTVRLSVCRNRNYLVTFFSLNFIGLIPLLGEISLQGAREWSSVCLRWSVSLVRSVPSLLERGTRSLFRHERGEGEDDYGPVQV